MTTTRFLNVKTDFGAIGDGTADDTAAVLNAITAAVDGATLFFPPGTYNLPNWVTYDLSGSLSIVGDRAELLAAGTPDNLVSLVAGAGASVSFQGLATDGLKFTDWGLKGALYLEQNNGQAGHGDVLFHQVECLDSHLIRDSNTNVWAGRSLIITNCYCHDGRSGIITRMMNCKTVVIDGNRVENVTRADTSSNGGIWIGNSPNDDNNANHVSVTNNMVDGVSSGTSPASNLSGILVMCQNATITGNSIKNVTGNAAEDFAEVYGIYTKGTKGIVVGNRLEHAGFDTGIVIKTTDAASIVSDNRLSYPTATGMPVKAIELQGDCACHGNIITGHVTACIYSAGSRVSICNNVMVDIIAPGSVVGIWVTPEMEGGIGGYNLHDSMIHDNLIVNFEGKRDAATYHALYVRSTAGGTPGIDGVSIQGNMVKNFIKTGASPNSSYGVRVLQEVGYDIDNVFIRDNIIDGTGRGISLSVNSGGTLGQIQVVGNTLANCSDDYLLTSNWVDLIENQNIVNRVLVP